MDRPISASCSLESSVLRNEIAGITEISLFCAAPWTFLPPDHQGAAVQSPLGSPPAACSGLPALQNPTRSICDPGHRKSPGKCGKCPKMAGNVAFCAVWPYCHGHGLLHPKQFNTFSAGFNSLFRPGCFPDLRLHPSILDSSAAHPAHTPKARPKRFFPGPCSMPGTHPRQLSERLWKAVHGFPSSMPFVLFLCFPPILRAVSLFVLWLLQSLPFPMILL